MHACLAKGRTRTSGVPVRVCSRRAVLGPNIQLLVPRYLLADSGTIADPVTQTYSNRSQRCSHYRADDSGFTFDATQKNSQKNGAT